MPNELIKLKQEDGVDEAYMTFQGIVYKLSPVEEVKATTALAVITKRASAKALSAARDAVQASIDALLRDAKDKRKEAATLLAQAKSVQSPPPTWAVAAGIPIKYSAGEWLVQMIIDFSITHFDTGWSDKGAEYKYSWEAKPNHLPMIMWVPVAVSNGAYNVSSVRVDTNCPELPHIGHNAACMSPDNPPKLLRNMDDLARLAECIERTLHRVNFGSLRFGLAIWYNRFKDIMPGDLAAALADKNVSKATELAKTYNVQKRDKVKESKSVFHNPSKS